MQGMLASYFWQSTIKLLKVYTRSNIAQCIYCLDNTPSVICPLCMQALPRLGQHCPQCAEPNHHGHVCGQCLKLKPSFDRVISPFVFQGPIAKIMQSFKRTPKVLGLNELTVELNQALAPYEFDMVIPMPYHWRKSLLRGHNPTTLLARKISRYLQVETTSILKRVKPTKSQQTLEKSQRRRNVRGAFEVPARYRPLLKGRNVLLIDDVLTTGATANEAAKILKRHGASSVIVACIARTPLQSHS